MSFDHWHNLTGDASSSAGNSSSFGSVMSEEYLLKDSGQASPVSGATAQSPASGVTTVASTGSLPAQTLVGSANGLQFDLTWDASVVDAPRGFIQAVVDAAKLYSTLYSNKAVINIDVGYGEIGGTTLPAYALGASDPFGYLTDYSIVTSVLSGDGFNFSAANEPTASQFFITSAEAKAMGLVDSAAGLDGFMGFSDLTGTGFSWNTAGSANGLNGGTKANQFDLQAVAEHEISEVMGRLGIEGLPVNGTPTYSPLDLFNYQSPGMLALSPNGGYFSPLNGFINLGNFNNAAANGGDIADWASNASIAQSGTLGLPRGSYDAYDAFTFPGVNGHVSLSDIVESEALGYTLRGGMNLALLGNYAASFAAPSFHGDSTGSSAVQAAVEQTLASHHV
ncbi:MAG TPA: NF038122 family metalloprotease [Xanthobacteraceae bacterium]|nr:NF038122 family metalloprotease [Xanthobacteraceae bacterium]